MAGLQHVAELAGDGYRPLLGEPPAAGEHPGEIGAEDVLHGDPEEVVGLPLLVDGRHLGRHLGELCLEGGAVALGLQHVGVGLRDADELQGDLGAALRVPGEVHVADRPAPQEVAKLEAADGLLVDQHVSGLSGEGWPGWCREPGEPGERPASGSPARS